MKKCKILFIIVVFFLLILFVYSNSKINGDFTIKKVYYGEFVFEESPINDKNTFVENMQESYNISDKESKEIFSERNNYVNITINYTIKNHSFLPLYIIKPIFCNNSNVYVCTEIPESQSRCFVAPNESATISTNIIVEKTAINDKFFAGLELNVLTFGLSPIVDISFSEYENVGNIVTIEESVVSMCPEIFSEEIYYYQPINNNDTKYSINEYNDYTLSYSRITSGYVYTVSRFVYKDQNYCGIAFYDENGMFKKGMAIHKLWDDKTVFDFPIGESSFDDVKVIDSGCMLFENDDGMKSYHYFRDKTCIEITYTKDKIISKIKEFSIDDMFEKLIVDDAIYIEKK